MMLVSRTGRTIAGIGLVLAIAACGESVRSGVKPGQAADPTPGAPDSDGGTRATRLLLSAGETREGPQRPLDGRLGIDSRGCVTLGERVVVAARGSRLGLDGQTVTLTGIGELRIGEEVSVGSGFLEDGERPISKLPEPHRGCSSTSYAYLTAGTVPDAPEPDALDCASGYSSGSIPDYFGNRGEATAAQAIAQAEVATRPDTGALPETRLVENTEDRVRAAFLDLPGTVTGSAIVVKVDGTWQIEGVGRCAPVGSVGIGPSP
jgi:hypothetical protein